MRMIRWVTQPKETVVDYGRHLGPSNKYLGLCTLLRSTSTQRRGNLQAILHSCGKSFSTFSGGTEITQLGFQYPAAAERGLMHHQAFLQACPAGYPILPQSVRRPKIFWKALSQL